MSKATQWAGAESNWWIPTGPTTTALPPDFYLLKHGFMGPFLASYAPKTDKAIVVEDSVSHRLINQIKKFHASRAEYARFGMLHKRGIMLEGPAGTGKTMTANIAGKFVVENGGVVISPALPQYFSKLPGFLTSLREVHPDLPVLCVLEDIDHEEYRDNVELHLALLDGQFQIGNCFYIATTNHIGAVDERLTNRPKRYDEVIHVGPPSAAARRSYLEQIVPFDQSMRKEVIEAITNATEGFMLAHLSEVMTAYLVLDHPLEEVVKRLRHMMAPPNDDDIMGSKAEAPAGGIWISADALKTVKVKRG